MCLHATHLTRSASSFPESSQAKQLARVLEARVENTKNHWNYIYGFFKLGSRFSEIKKSVESVGSNTKHLVHPSPAGHPTARSTAVSCRICLVFCFKPWTPNNCCDFLGNTSAAALDTESATPNGLFQTAWWLPAYFSCYSQHLLVHPHFAFQPPYPEYHHAAVHPSQLPLPSPSLWLTRRKPSVYLSLFQPLDNKSFAHFSADINSSRLGNSRPEAVSPCRILLMLPGLPTRIFS